MKRKIQPTSYARTLAIVVVSAGLAACLACFTQESSAKDTPPRRLIKITVALEVYHTDFRALGNVELEPTSTPPVLPFSASSVGAGLADFEIHGPQYGVLTPLPQPGETLIHDLPSELTALVLLGPGSEPFAIDSFFDITYRVSNIGGLPPGAFETELLSLELMGHHPTLGDVVLRESPTLPSLGLHTIIPEADGMHAKVDSFFDVFFELSIDGGPFVPGDASLRMYLTNVPEPGTIALVLIAAVGCGAMARRRRRR